MTDPAEVLAMQRACARVLVDEHVLGYISALVRATRRWPTFALGVSPRAGVAILRAAGPRRRSPAGTMSCPTTSRRWSSPRSRHRVMLTPEAEIEGRSPDELLSELVRSVEVPLR